MFSQKQNDPAASSAQFNNSSEQSPSNFPPMPQPSAPLPTNTPADNSVKLAFSQEKKFDIEYAPIHTMQKDLKDIASGKLENLDKPDSQPQNFQVSSASLLSPKQATSPFLSAEIPSINKTVDEPENSVPNKPRAHNWNLIVFSSIIIFTLLLAGAGGYYYWITRDQTGEIEKPPVSEKTPIETPPIISFSTASANYLSIDMENADGAKIKEILIQYSEKVSQINAGTPIEFVVVDSKNNPVTFQNFAEKAGIKFSPDLLSSLNGTFSLFLFDDSGKNRIGLALDSLDAEKMSSLVKAEEKTLPGGLEPIFLAADYTLEEKEFSTGSYGASEIRYLNITSLEELSVDYSIYDGKLLIGTSKMTLRATIDKVKSSSTVQGVDDMID